MAKAYYGGMNKNVVDDETAPAYFSQRALWTFSILFSVFFGSILMAINLSKTESKKGVGMVIGFGLLYTVIEIWALNNTKAGTSATFVFNAIGAIVLQYLFWNKYIGSETLYRAKPVWIPSIIGAIMAALFIGAIVYGVN